MAKSCSMWDLSAPTGGRNYVPLQWKLGVITTGPSGVSINLEQFLSFPWPSQPWLCWRIQVICFVECPSVCICLTFSYDVDSGYAFLALSSVQGIRRRVMLACLGLGDVNLGFLAKVVSPRFRPGKVAVFCGWLTLQHQSPKWQGQGFNPGSLFSEPKLLILLLNHFSETTKY